MNGHKSMRTCEQRSMWIRVLGSRVLNLVVGFRVHDLGNKVWGSQPGFFGFRVHNPILGFQGSRGEHGFRVHEGNRVLGFTRGTGF